MRWALIILAVAAAAAVTAVLIGMTLPADHVASVRVRLDRPPATVYAAIADVAASTAWRHDLDRVDVLSAAGEPLRWRETGRFGSITFERESHEPPNRLVHRIVDTGEGFGGTWTFDVSPDQSATLLTITENGSVYNPVFRFMSRFVFGHYGTLEQYAHALSAHLGQDAPVERVVAPAS